MIDAIANLIWARVGAVWESFSPVNVERARRHPDVFKVETAIEYLTRINKQIKNAGGVTK